MSVRLVLLEREPEYLEIVTERPQVLCKCKKDLKKLFVNSKTTDDTNGAGTSYPSGAPDFIPGFQDVRFAQSLVFCIVFCR
jgi:hypothetical protein